MQSQSRPATHAGSWYSDSPETVRYQIDYWLYEAKKELEDIASSLPKRGGRVTARIIIAPHAGFAYSGRCAAYAYKIWDLTNVKRIFVLGPAHHHYCSSLALPEYTAYHTPLAAEALPLDVDAIAELRAKKAIGQDQNPIDFATLTRAEDGEEHSIEMHLPFIHRMLQLQFPGQPPSKYPPLVPIVVGAIDDQTEQAFGNLLAPYLGDKDNAFVISSDFCHWGTRFDYTYFTAAAPSPGPLIPVSKDLPWPGLKEDDTTRLIEICQGGSRRTSRDAEIYNPPIYASISALDLGAMAAIATGRHEEFSRYLRDTRNTVCGRHPIGVIMAAVERLGLADTNLGRFRFIRYDRSSNVRVYKESSVSYASAFALL
ncbi:DUF52 domain protein [Aspergillus sclerotioniger CBS 115572]|uniref:DUF52 domain protein n=1 Tax=Aspergillus sclerotioniger CBS 115572 TaxID=1450535 RepID=A0A317VXN5_9EURO|nr:DUF52 domain protein [Aspergillus sclerotioniger CBS 115572]PWY78555.1 DUF52 domain protein [Aspergillus sclerotioniger CBS 115572]